MTIQITKFSEAKKTFDPDSGTTTVWIDKDRVLKISAADSMATTGNIIESTCRANKIPPRVVNHIEGQIENVAGFVASEKKTKRKTKTKIKVIKKEVGQRLSKLRKRSLLSFIRQFIDTTEEFSYKEIRSLVGNIPIDRVMKFLEGEGYSVSKTKEGIKVSHK